MSKAAKGFPPVVDAGIETLILGSFPSVASLGKAQYYGHPQNHFWRLVGAVIGEPLRDMEYRDRLRTLLKNRIGLWDVIGNCVRAGSLDSDIRNACRNDFSHVLKVARRLQRVCFNGKTSGRLEPWFAAQGFETIVLPSSSPAYTLAFDRKLAAWQHIVAPGAALAGGAGSAPPARKLTNGPYASRDGESAAGVRTRAAHSKARNTPAAAHSRRAPDPRK